MADETLFIKKSSLTKIGDAVRTKGGTTEPLSVPDGIVNAVAAIPAGGGGGGYPQDNPAMTHNLPRGKFLGTSVTEKQYADIANGTFEDMYVGDYWTIDGVDWLIACVNYYKGNGIYDNGWKYVEKNHLVIVPRTALYKSIMKNGGISGGYYQSKMYNTGLNQAEDTINKIFAGHVITKYIYLPTNFTENGVALLGRTVESTVDLMSTTTVFGFPISHYSPFTGQQFEVRDMETAEPTQFPLFFYFPDTIRLKNDPDGYYLRDVYSFQGFALVSPLGLSSIDGSIKAGVRPYFCIG